VSPHLRTLNVFHAAVSFTLVLTLLGWLLSVQAAAQTRHGTLVQISIENSDNDVAIRLIADQALYGEIQEITVEPFRLFVDFANIVPKVAAVTPVETVGVRQVRVALNQIDPPVTRVVLDLTQQHPYQIEQHLENLEYRIIVRSSDAGTKTKLGDIKKEAQSEPLASLTPALLNDYIVWFTRAAKEFDQLLSLEPAPIEMENESQESIRTNLKRLQTEHGLVMPPSSLQVAHNILRAALQLGHLATIRTAHPDETQANPNAARRGAELLLRRARSLAESHLVNQKEDFR